MPSDSGQEDPRASTGGGSLHCPSCEHDFPDGTDRCPSDGTKLIRLPSETDDLVGRELDGRFVVRERLGEGGMGTVYRAWQASVGREIALKIIHRRHASDATAAKRFLREARLASRLSHPHTVSVLDFGQTRDGLLYLAMELLRGRTLAQVISQDGRFSVERMVRVGAQLCDALEAAHRLQIVHRDLKPGNVVVLDDPPGRDLIKVLDFGLAKSVSVEETHSTVSRAGAVMGTPAYMSPEQVQGLAVDARSDLYSLGVILYELVSRRLPFDSETGQGMMLAHTNDVPNPLPEAPRVVESVISRLLEKEPADRFQSAGVVREALLAAADAARSSRERLAESSAGTALPSTDSRDMPLADTRPVHAPHSVAAPRPRTGLRLGLAAAALAPLAVGLWALLRPPSPKPVSGVTVDAGALPVAVPDRREPTPPPAIDAAVAAAPPVDAAIEMVEITITSDPRASFSVAGQTGSTPAKIRVPRGTKRIPIVLRAERYRRATKSVLPDRDQRVHVELELDTL